VGLAALVVVLVGAWRAMNDGDLDRQAPSPSGDPGSRSPGPSAVASKDGVLSARVSGRVLQSGAPVPKAQVTLKGAATFVGLTLDDGQFLFTDVPPGQYALGASKGESLSRTLGPITLTARSDERDLTLVLEVSGRLEGVVVDLLGHRPIAAANVESAGGRAVADLEGRFSVPTPPGPLWIDVSAPGYLRRSEWLSAPSGGKLEFVLSPASILEGAVLESEAPVAFATVWAEYQDGARSGTRSTVTMTDAAGQFRLETAAGALRLSTVTPRGTRVIGPLERVAVGEKKVGLLLVVKDAGFIDGLAVRDGQPLAGAQLSVIDAKTEQTVAMIATGLDGAFRIDSIVAGRFLVQARLGEWAAIAGPLEHQGTGATWNLAFPGGRGLHGRVEPPVAGALVRLRKPGWTGASVEGRTDALGRFHFEGVSEPRVWLDALSAQGSATATVSPGQDVVLHLEAAYVIIACVDGAGAKVTDGVVLARHLETGALHREPVLSADGVVRIPLARGSWELVLEASGRGRSSTVTVPVAAENVAHIRLSLEAFTSVSGTVRDAATQLPLEGASVTAFSGELGRGFRLSVLTDAQGGFWLPETPVGGVVRVAREGFTPQWKRAIEASAWAVSLSRAPAGRQDAEPTQFEGVGLVLEGREGLTYVTAVSEGGPAERSGVLKGDAIIAVDGVSVVGVPMEQIVGRVRGPSGTAVTVRFLRKGQEFELVLRRKLLAL
jgi:hypothetical protein